jgi:glycosyltransferase involved in cell wall biosynthesis
MIASYSDQHHAAAALYQAPISAVPAGTTRPLLSVMIPTYNCAHYLSETLASVLAQDLGPEHMQIEVIDDCSTSDDPAAVVAALGRGRVGFYRQPANGGHTRNFNTCIQRSRGHLVHLLHGDDLVRDGFYRKLKHAFELRPEIGAAYCRHIIMDDHGHWQSISPLEQPESGILPNWLERIAVGQRLQAPSIVVRRSVYEHLGGFDRRMRYYAEDWEMWVRIAARYPVWYEVEPLAVYRIRSSSLSGRTVRTGENGADLRRAIEINRASLPREQAAALSRQARENNALACIRRAHRMLNAGEMQAPVAQLREAVRFSRSVNVVGRTMIVFALWATRAIRSADVSSRSKRRPF